MRVAVCDDNTQDIERIKRYTIRMIEYAVDYEFFTKTEELVAAYKKAEQKPDMYILDIEMPGMDGLAVAKKIRTYDSKADYRGKASIAFFKSRVISEHDKSNLFIQLPEEPVQS